MYSTCFAFENEYQTYTYSNTHYPTEKTYLCIYSIYIVSVSFAYNMQTATWWFDSTEIHLKDKAGEGNMCMGGTEPGSSTYTPLDDWEYMTVGKITDPLLPR